MNVFLIYLLLGSFHLSVQLKILWLCVMLTFHKPYWHGRFNRWPNRVYVAVVVAAMSSYHHWITIFNLLLNVWITISLAVSITFPLSVSHWSSPSWQSLPFPVSQPFSSFTIRDAPFSKGTAIVGRDTQVLDVNQRNSPNNPMKIQEKKNHCET